ncbi:MAG TPA: M4 family metallopeptidase [Micromonosporaceae bacterium]
MRSPRVLAACAVVALTGLLLTAAAPPGRRSDDASLAGSTPAGAARGAGTSMLAAGWKKLAPPAGSLSADEAIQELRGGKNPPAIETGPQGGVVSLVAPPGSTIASPAKDVDGFVRRYAAAFGLSSRYVAQRDRLTRLPGGDSVTRYRQLVGGVPVFGGEILVSADARGRVRGVVAETTPALPASTVAAVAAGTAARTAVAAAAQRFDLAAASLRTGDPALWIYDPTLIGAPGVQSARPTWFVDVVGADGGAVASVLVDASDGAVVLLGRAKREAGLDRIVCDLANAKVDTNNPATHNCTPSTSLGHRTTTRTEQSGPSTVAEVNTAFNNLGAAHDFFRTNYQIDSFDGWGGQLRATVRICDLSLCPYPNAFWDGAQFAFGTGFAVDDVVGHEYTHAVIDHSSQLAYWYEAGAINESLADIFGEFVDQSYAGVGEDTSKLWLLGEDLPLQPGESVREVRDLANPGRLGQPSVYFGPNYYSGDADNGGVHQNSGVGNHLAYLIANGGTDQWTTFPGIGVAKSRQLWYRVLNLLPSGAGYPTLGRLVTQACVELIGTFGFTRDDCFVTVRYARSASGLNYAESAHGCYGGSSADPFVFADDFEQRDKWTLGAGWYYLPSPSHPLPEQTYAASGKGSLFGYTPTNGATIYATMKDPVTIPSNTTYSGPYLSYKLLPYTLGYFETANGPMFQYDDVSDGAGWQNLGSASMVRGGDYSEYEVSVNALAGKTVRLRMRIMATDVERAWLVDDLYINACTYRYFSRATDVAAVWSGTSAEISWRYSSMPSDHIEFSYDPPIPGAPTSLAGLGVNQSDVLRSITLNNLDPSLTYTITISIIDDQNHQTPYPVSLRFSSQPPPVCLERLPPMTVYWSQYRTRPVADPCRQAVVLPDKDGDG